MAYVIEYEVVGIFPDESENTLGLSQAIRAIESGEANVFVSFNKTTISKNIAEFNEFQKKLVECGGTLHVFNPETFPEEI